MKKRLTLVAAAAMVLFVLGQGNEVLGYRLRASNWSFPVLSRVANRISGIADRMEARRGDRAERWHSYRAQRHHGTHSESSCEECPADEVPQASHTLQNRFVVG